jgi:hypothetical protein
MCRTLAWSVNAAFCLVALTSQPVLADCNSLLADAKVLARYVAVKVDAPPTSPAAS